MKYLLIDRLVDIIRHQSDERTLRQGIDRGLRNQRVELCVGRGRLVVRIDCHGRTELHDFTETLGQVACRLAAALARE